MNVMGESHRVVIDLTSPLPTGVSSKRRRHVHAVPYPQNAWLDKVYAPRYMLGWMKLMHQLHELAWENDTLVLLERAAVRLVHVALKFRSVQAWEFSPRDRDETLKLWATAALWIVFKAETGCRVGDEWLLQQVKLKHFKGLQLRFAEALLLEVNDWHVPVPASRMEA